MKVSVQSIHFDADKKLLDFIQKKVDKLDQYSERLICGEVYLKLENVEEETNKVSEVKISVPGGTMFAKEKCKSFEEATDLAVDSIIRQIKKQKEKLRTH